MPNTYKVLGHVYDDFGANSDILLYTVPTGKSAVVSTLHVTNTTTSASTFRIKVIPAGSTETFANEFALAYDTPLGANSLITLTEGITLAAGDKVEVCSGAPGFVFFAFGSELDA